MLTFRSILCPVDFSEYSNLALRYANAFAHQYQSTLVIFHAVQPVVQASTHLDVTGFDMEPLVQAARQKLDRLAAEVLSPEIQVSKIVQINVPAEGILEKVKEINADLIVMGTHGMTGFEAHLFGSVTHTVLHHARVPVFAVCKPKRHFIQQDEQQPFTIRRILCPLDFNHTALPVQELALSLARSYQSDLFLMHVQEITERKMAYSYPKKEAHPYELWDSEQIHLEDAETREQKERIISKLKSIADPENENWCTVHYLASFGHPADEILKAAEANRIDLVVMGHHSRLPLVEAIVGSVTRRVITGSNCPVLVIRS